MLPELRQLKKFHTIGFKTKKLLKSMWWYKLIFFFILCDFNLNKTSKPFGYKLVLYTVRKRINMTQYLIQNMGKTCKINMENSFILTQPFLQPIHCVVVLSKYSLFEDPGSEFGAGLSFWPTNGRQVVCLEKIDR